MPDYTISNLSTASSKTNVFAAAKFYASRDLSQLEDEQEKDERPKSADEVQGLLERLKDTLLSQF